MFKSWQSQENRVGKVTQRAAGAKNWRRDLFLAPRLVGARFWRQTDNLVPKTIVLAPESIFWRRVFGAASDFAPGFGAKSWRRCFFCFWRLGFWRQILAPFLHLAPRCSWLASACTGPPSSLHRFRRAAKHCTLPASGRPAYLGTGPTNKLHNSSI